MPICPPVSDPPVVLFISLSFTRIVIVSFEQSTWNVFHSPTGFSASGPCGHLDAFG